MKITSLLFALFFSTTALANTSLCLDEVEQEYYSESRINRYSRVLETPDFLAANETIVFGRNITIGPFDADTFLFHAKGSYHSGFFHNVIVVDPQSCEIQKIKMVADE